MTYKHITVSLPAVPMGADYANLFPQKEEALLEYNTALAAPELLEALIAVKAHLFHTFEEGEKNPQSAAYDRVVAAIAKATGG
jgi:hypothetical protein